MIARPRITSREEDRPLAPTRNNSGRCGFLGVGAYIVESSNVNMLHRTKADRLKKSPAMVSPFNETYTILKDFQISAKRIFVSEDTSQILFFVMHFFVGV